MHHFGASGFPGCLDLKGLYVEWLHYYNLDLIFQTTLLNKVFMNSIIYVLSKLEELRCFWNAQCTIYFKVHELILFLFVNIQSGYFSCTLMEAQKIYKVVIFLVFSWKLLTYHHCTMKSD